MCIKNEKRSQPKIGWHRCKSCGAVAKKKTKLCKPKKINKRKQLQIA